MKSKINKEMLAAKFNRMDYVDELPDRLIDTAADNNLVIIHGNNRDMVCMDGAITDEIDAFEGKMIHFDKEGFLDFPCGGGCRLFEKYLKASQDAGDVIGLKAWWCGRFGAQNMDSVVYGALGKPAWYFDCSSIEGKFATFNIKERQQFNQGVKYFCRAIIIDLAEIWPSR